MAIAQATLTPSQITSDPELFAAKFLRILDKQKRLIPLKWNRAQKDFHYHRTGRDLILKARQIGFSTYIQGEIFRRLVTRSSASFTISHKDSTTQLLRIMSDRFYEHCAFNDIQPMREIANASMAKFSEFDSVSIIATAGSKQTGRGGTYTDFHGSEVAFWKDAEALVAGAMEGGNPDVILESTPNGAQGYFFERCKESLDGRGIWKLHFYPWWWDEAYQIPLESGERIKMTEEEQALSTNLRWGGNIQPTKKLDLSPAQIKWRRKKIETLGATLFQQEYPEDPIQCFRLSGNSYFGDMTGVFTAPMNAKHAKDHEYGAGLDFGQANDYTVLSVVDFTVRQQVALLRMNKLPWAEMRERIAQEYRRWHLQSIIAEKNSIGEPNIEELAKLGVEIFPFTTDNESKANIMSNMNEKLHHGGWKLLPIPEQESEFQSFVATQLPSLVWRLAAIEGAHDDIVMADGLVIGASPVQIFL